MTAEHSSAIDGASPGPESSVPKERCPHHWVIETPNGATSQGVCKRCGAVKAHPNGIGFSKREWNRRTPRRPRGRDAVNNTNPIPDDENYGNYDNIDL